MFKQKKFVKSTSFLVLALFFGLWSPVISEALRVFPGQSNSKESPVQIKGFNSSPKSVFSITTNETKAPRSQNQIHSTSEGEWVQGPDGKPIFVIQIDGEIAAFTQEQYLNFLKKGPQERDFPKSGDQGTTTTTGSKEKHSEEGHHEEHAPHYIAPHLHAPGHSSGHGGEVHSPNPNGASHSSNPQTPNLTSTPTGGMKAVVGKNGRTYYKNSQGRFVSKQAYEASLANQSTQTSPGSHPDHSQGGDPGGVKSKISKGLDSAKGAVKEAFATNPNWTRSAQQVSGQGAVKYYSQAGYSNFKTHLKANFSAGSLATNLAVTSALELGRQISNGEKPSLGKVARIVTSGNFIGAVVGGGVGSAAGSFIAPALSAVPVVGGVLSALAPAMGAVAGSMFGSGVGSGKSLKEALKAVDWWQVAGQGAGHVVGAALGSLIFPPIGTIVGGMIGGWVGGKAAGFLKGLFGGKKDSSHSGHNIGGDDAYDANGKDQFGGGHDLNDINFDLDKLPDYGEGDQNSPKKPAENKPNISEDLKETIKENKGKIVGGVVGTGVGAVIGHEIQKNLKKNGKKDGPEGELIGAAVGLGLGILIGNEVDKKRGQKEKELQNLPTKSDLSNKSQTKPGEKYPRMSSSQWVALSPHQAEGEDMSELISRAQRLAINGNEAAIALSRVGPKNFRIFLENSQWVPVASGNGFVKRAKYPDPELLKEGNGNWNQPDQWTKRKPQGQIKAFGTYPRRSASEWMALPPSQTEGVDMTDEVIRAKRFAMSGKEIENLLVHTGPWGFKKYLDGTHWVTVPGGNGSVKQVKYPNSNWLKERVN